ncbi:MAG: flippase [Actinomycetota bacterium]
MTSVDNSDRRFQARRLARQSSTLLTSGVFTYAAALLLNVILARALGPSEFGAYVVAFSITNALSLIGLLGVDWIMLRYGSFYEGTSDHPRLRKTFHLGFLISGVSLCLTGGILIALSAPTAVHIFHSPALTTPLRLAGLMVPLLGLTQVMLYGVQAFKRVKEVAIVSSLLQPLVRIICVVGCLVVVASPTSAFVGLLGSQVAVAFMATFVLNRRFPLRGKTAEIPVREMIKFGIPAWGTKLVENLRAQLFPVILGSIASLSASGIYTASRKIAAAPTAVNNSLNRVYTPIAGDLHLQNRKEELAALFKNVGKWGFMLAFPLFVFLITFPTDILAIFGEGFSGAESTLVILAFAMLFNFLTGPVTSTLILTGRSTAALVDYVIVVVVEISLGLWLIPDHGIVGAAIAKLVGTAINNIVPLIQVWMSDHMHPFRRDHWKPSIAGISAGALSALMIAVIDLDPGVPTAVTGAIALAAIYSLLLILFRFSVEDKEALVSLLRPGRKRADETPLSD